MAMAEAVHRGTVLLVEDDANALHQMREYLVRANFDVRTASNGWEAFRRLRDGEVDLVVTESAVSDVDGASLRERCIMSPEARDIPFIVLLGAGDNDSHVRALRSGVDDCIVKPVDPVVLVARVQAVLERRRTYAEMVRIDPLTRVLNRQALMRELQEELQRVHRYSRLGTLLLLDLDHFAEVNREGGMAMGDLLLTCLAGVILTNLRTSDRAGRYRGEKFLLYLPETPPDGALVLAKRLQDKLGLIADSVAAIPLTLSCGIVATPAHGRMFDVLLPRVEAALAAAKAQGPGHVALWDPEIGDRPPVHL